MTKKYKWIIADVSVVVLCAVVASYALWADSTPGLDETNPGKIAKYMASDEFAKLDESTRREYFRALRDNADKLSDQDRDKLRESMGRSMRQQMQARLDEYFELPADQRQAHLDNIIDRMQARRANGMPAPGNPPPDDRPNGQRGPRRGFTPDRLKRMIENTPPERRAKMAEFMKAMRKRMEERGISGPGH